MKNLKNNQYVALLTVAAITVSSLAVGAHAGEVALDGNRRAVHYQDLNLNTEAGAQVLYRRIRAAAAQVCGDTYSKQLDQAAAARTCMTQAIESSVRAVGNAQVTRTANAHGYRVEMPLSVASVR